MEKETPCLVTSILNSATTVPGHGVAVSSHLPKTLCSSDPVRLPLRQSLGFRKVPGHRDQSSRVGWEAVNSFRPLCRVPQWKQTARPAPGRAGLLLPCVPPGAGGPSPGLRGCDPWVTAPPEVAFRGKRTQAPEILYHPPLSVCSCPCVFIRSPSLFYNSNVSFASPF